MLLFFSCGRVTFLFPLTPSWLCLPGWVGGWRLRGPGARWASRSLPGPWSFCMGALGTLGGLQAGSTQHWWGNCKPPGDPRVPGPSCPKGAWRGVHLGLVRPQGSQSLMVLNPLWWLPRPWGKGRRGDGCWWLAEMPAKPRNPQGEPLGVTAPSSCLGGRRCPPPGGYKASLPPHPSPQGHAMTLGRWWTPRLISPQPLGRGVHRPFGGPWTHWSPLRAQRVQQWHCKKVSFYKRKRKNKWWFFLIKKPQTINKCKYIISGFTCKKIR